MRKTGLKQRGEGAKTGWVIAGRGRHAKVVKQFYSQAHPSNAMGQYPGRDFSAACFPPFDASRFPGWRKARGMNRVFLGQDNF